MRGLNLISDSADRELDAIRRTVRVFERVGTVRHVIDAMQSHATRGTRAEVVDLIGHSRRHGFVMLGAWQLDDSPQTAATFREELGPALSTIGIQMIRLLGCSTALKERGLAAMRRIEQAAGRPVLGTRRYISQHDYGAEGFISEDALVGWNRRPIARPDPVGFLATAASTIQLSAVELSAGPKLRSDQPLLPVNEAIAAEILTFVDATRSWVLPGLLAEPSRIVLWSQANTIHRLDLLFDGHVARAYGAYPDDDHGRLFRIRDSDGLNRYLDAVLHPHSAPPARTT